MKKIAVYLSCISILVFTACEKDLGSKILGYNYDRGVGASSEDLVSKKAYTDLKVQLIYMEGMQPQGTSIDNLETFLEKHLNKDDVIIVQKEIPAEGKSSYSISDIRSLEDKHRSVFNSGEELSASMLFLDGNYSESDGVLGIAYNNTSTVLFESRIQELSGGIFQPSREKLETAVMNHEFGHLMGLVATGAPLSADHHDEANGAHCTNQDCLMYFAVETGDFIENLRNSPVPELDTDCQNDLDNLR